MPKERRPTVRARVPVPMHEALARAAGLSGQTTTEVLVDALSAELVRRGVWPVRPEAPAVVSPVAAAPVAGPVVALVPPPTDGGFGAAYKDVERALSVAEASLSGATFEDVEHAFDRAGDREREITAEADRAFATSMMDRAHVRLAALRNRRKKGDIAEI